MRPNGFASAFSKHCPGSTSDLNIMHDPLEIYKCNLQNRDEEIELEDEFLMSGKYQNCWGALIDKGYQSAADVLRAVTQRKKTVRGYPSLDDEEYNMMFLSDRILVENYFGRLGQLWTDDQPNLYGLKTYTSLYSDQVLRLRIFTLVYIICEMKTETGTTGMATDWMTLDKQVSVSGLNRKERLNIGYRRKILTNDETVELE